MVHLDDLDIKIIRELGSPSSPQWNVRESYANISRKLGVDEETIRLRVKRAKEHGFLPTWGLMVNPYLLDREAVSLELEVDSEERKTKAISQIKFVDGVTRIHDFRGKSLQVSMYSERGESLSRKIQLIEAICGSPKTAFWESRFPIPNVSMKKIDWKIVKALREDARRDLNDVAEQLGVSARTVQRRLAAMMEGKAIYLSGNPNLDVVEGVLCCFHVLCPDRLKKREVDNVIHSDLSRISHLDTSPEEYSIFAMPCENFAEADRVLEGLKAIDGVQNAKMHIMRELIVVQDWLKHEIDRRISSQ